MLFIRVTALAVGAGSAVLTRGTDRYPERVNVMRVLCSAALAVVLTAAVPALGATYPAPKPFDSGNGNLQAPLVTVGICGFQADGVTARPCNPGEIPPGGSSASGSTTTTPYVQGTATNSATAGSYTQALAADPSRTACTVTNTGTGQQSIIQAATQPPNGTVSPLPTISPNGFYSCGGYKGAVWIASTVASDPYGYEGDR